MPSEHNVLAVGEAHVGAEVPLEGGQGPELVAGDVAQMGLGVHRDGAVSHAPHHVGPLPALVGAARADAHRGAVADGGDVRGVACAGRIVALRPAPRRGCRPARTWRPPGTLRWVSTRRCTSSKPSVSTSHFIRARSLLSRLPAWSNTLRQASIVGRSSSRGVKSSRARAGWGVVPRPPAMNTLKPRSTSPAAGLAYHADHADVVEHRLAAVGLAAREVDLELAGQPLADRIPDEMAVGRLRPGCDVEYLVGAGAGQVAALDVADRVSAGLPGGEAHRGQVLEHLRVSGRGPRSGIGCSGGW